MANKREKIEAVLNAAENWVRVYSLDDDASEEDYDECCKGLVDTCEVLAKHKARKHTPMKNHPQGDYYSIEVGGRTIPRVRCKLCGHELKPTGFSRHVNKAICKARQKSLRDEVEKDKNKDKDKEE